jgi:anti-sigma factor RsiW
MKPDLELKLQALLDAELPPAEAEQVRRLAAADPEAARLLAELQNIKAALCQNEPFVAVPETRAFYWSKIQRQIQSEAGRSPSPAPSWSERFRRWLVPLAGMAAGVAVLLLLLHQSAPQVALNEVSPAAGAKARAFRDNSAGINFVVVQETSPPPATFADPPPARTRNDGSSFMIELE